MQALAWISVASVGRRIMATYSGLFYPLLFTACFLCVPQASLFLGFGTTTSALAAWRDADAFSVPDQLKRLSPDSVRWPFLAQGHKPQHGCERKII